MFREFRLDVVMTRAIARAHDNIEVINLRALSADQLGNYRWHHTCLEYHINGILYHGFMLSFRLYIRRVNRTTCPATLIVAWLVDLYIEGLFDIGMVTLLQSSPPENTRDSTRVFVISGRVTCFVIGVRLVLVSFFGTHVVCVTSHRRHVKLYWLRVCCYLSLITII